MVNQSRAALRYRIDGLELDLGTCELIHNDTVLQLPKLSFNLLASLVRHAPNVVAVDQLIDDVWDGRVVAEETVTQRVKLLRDALAQFGYTRKIITTVRGRGYRLTSPVEQVVDDIEPAVRTSRSYVRAAAILVLLITLVATGWRLLVIERTPIDDNSIAVIPFEDFTAEQTAGYIGDGIAEELLNRFAQIPGLHVASRTSSFRFRDRDEDIRSIAEQLGVGTVLEGSVRNAESRFRITVQLIDAETDRHIWSEQFDRELTDILDIQEDIAAAVVDKFQLERPTEGALQRPKIDADVVDVYLRGRHQLRARTSTSLESAIVSFEKVIAIQPDYAPAHAALATAYIGLSRRGNLSTDDAERLASEALRRALELDSQSAEAHATLGLLKMSTGDSNGAKTALNRALAINPNLSDAILWQAQIMRSENRFDEAKELFERALDLDPLNVAANDALTFYLLEDGDYDATIAQFERRRRIEDSDGETRRLMAMTARTFGRLDSAVLWARDAVRIDPDSPLNTNELVMAYSAIGEAALATELAEENFARSPDNHWTAAQMAFTYINSGDFDTLELFTREQLKLVARSEDASLRQSDRVRLATAGIASLYAQRFEDAEDYIARALGEPLTGLFETQFEIGLLGALAYLYEKNGKPERAEEMIQTTQNLIDGQKGWVFKELIYADSIAALQMLRGDRDNAVATLRRALANGWVGHRGFLNAPMWRDLYDSDEEFRVMMDDLQTRIEAMRSSIKSP